MKAEIHPELKEAKVKCTGCGNEFATLSVLEEIEVGICSNCHPFFTGTKKLVDTEGRIDKFKRRQKDSQDKQQKHQDKKNKKEKKNKNITTIA